MTIIIAPIESAVYRIDVVTPNGDRWEVEDYRLLSFSECIKVANQTNAVMQREQPFGTDPEPIRDLWRSLVATDIDPATCIVEIVRKSKCADEQAPNGWKTVVKVEPVSASVG